MRTPSSARARHHHAHRGPHDVGVPETTKRGRGRPALDLDEDAALGLAAEAFAEGGLAGTSMKTIAARCGVAKSTLHDRFGTKEMLFERAVERERQQFADHLVATYETGRDEDAATQIRDGYVAFFTYARSRPVAFRLLFGEAGAGTATATRGLVADRIAEIIASRFARAGLPLGASSRVVAAAIVGAGEAVARLMVEIDDLGIDATTVLVAELLTDGWRGLQIDHLLAVDAR